VAGAFAVPGGTSLRRSVCIDCSRVAGVTNPKLGHSSVGGTLSPVVIEASSRVIDIGNVVIVWVGKRVSSEFQETCVHDALHVMFPPCIVVVFPPSHCGHHNLPQSHRIN